MKGIIPIHHNNIIVYYLHIALKTLVPNAGNSTYSIALSASGFSNKSTATVCYDVGDKIQQTQRIYESCC